MKRKYILIILILLLNVGLEQSAVAETMLRVGVLQVSPFAYQEDDAFKGMAVDLWQILAQENGWKYRYVMTDTKAASLLRALHEKKLDVVIGSVSVTHNRLALVDFSRAYYINPMVLLVADKSTSIFQALWQITIDIINYKFRLFFGIVVFLICINLLWWFEYAKKNRKQYRRKLRDLVWNSILIVFTRQKVGNFKTGYARLIVVMLLLMIFAGVGLVIVTFSSAMTLSLSDQVYSMSDIEHKPIAVVSGTFQQTLAQEVGLKYLVYRNRQSEIQALLKKEVEGVLMDLPAARFYLKYHNYLHLRIAPFIVSYNEVAFAFQLNSPYTRAFDLSLTALQDRREAKNICEIYIGKKEADLCNL